MLLQNATQFATAKVLAEITLEGDSVCLTILDDGPGFDEALIDSLGEPYFSTGDKGRGNRERSSGAHMGLGLFIERGGAELTFANRHNDLGQGRRSVAGAKVSVTWPKDSLDSGEASK